MISQNKIEEQFGSIIYEFEIPHVEWELDSKGWVCEKNGNRKIILSDHGKPYISDSTELSEKIKYLNEVIENIKEAIKFVKE